MADMTDQSRIALDLLLGRLRWPVPMVRWRAARALRDLLEDPLTRTHTERALLDELSNCRTEYRACEILTIFLCTSPGARARDADILASLTAPSITAEILLRHICGHDTNVDWHSGHSGAAPADYKATQYFKDFRTSHAPPRMSDNIFHFQKRTGRPFFRQWAWEWERLTEVTAAPHTNYPYHFDDFGEVRSGLHGHYQQSQADIYRSAYLRCFAFAVDQWDVPAQAVAHYCAEFLPIAAGLFDLDPVQRPAWLSRLPEQCASGEISLQAAAEAILAAADLAGEPALSMHVPFNPEVEPFGYLRITGYLAEPGFELGEVVPEPPADFMPTTDGLAFRGPLPTDTKERGRVAGRAGTAVSTVSNLIPLPFGQWQGFFGRAGMPVPAAVIGGIDASIDVATNMLLVEDPQGPIATTRYWLDHWSPREPSDGATPCGAVCVVNEMRLRRALETTSARLFWIAQIRLWRREKDHEPYVLLEEHVGFWARRE